MSQVERVKINDPSLDPSYALSTAAKEIDRFSGLVEKSHEDRIQQVCQMMADGTYQVSSEDIAGKLVQSSRK